MTTQAIDQPFVASTALRSVNFFNGRLLTGDDLSREQATQEALRRRLGRAAGEGIAFGFEVEEQPALTSKQKPVVTVSAGLAVTRSGIALQLDAELDVALYRDATAAPPGAEAGNLFADCQPTASGTYTAGAGVYLLTVGPGEEPEGRAPVNGLGNENAICNVALEAEALAFRLIRLSVPLAQLSEKQLLRNRVAYECFGVDELASDAANPFGPVVTRYGLLDSLRTQTLTDDEVPLAAIGWSIDDGIQFVDLWSVRRRLLRNRRASEREAILRQFAAQLEDLRVDPDAAMLEARECFEHLPPVGLLPLAASFAGGFDLTRFFDSIKTTDPVFMEGAKLDGLLAEAAFYPPIDPASPEAVRLYLVRENEQAAAPTTRYVVFVNGHVAYRGDAQFDLAYYDFANYAQAYC
jgi:hypothetical protein